MCRQITWSILTDGRSFFNRVLVEAQFCRGEHFKWPTSLIHKITDDVRFAKPIDNPFCLAEWLITTSNGQGTVGNNGGGGSYGGRNNQGANKEPTKVQQPQGRSNSGGGGNRPQPWVDDRHPRFVAMMANYVAALGLRVQLNEILGAATKCITDLPRIPKYVNNGRPFVC
jgi:hypothetical protein